MKYPLRIKHTKIRNVLFYSRRQKFDIQTLQKIFYAFELFLYIFLFLQRKSHCAFVSIKLFVFIKSSLFERFIITIF